MGRSLSLDGTCLLLMGSDAGLSVFVDTHTQNGIRTESRASGLSHGISGKGIICIKKIKRILAGTSSCVQVRW